MTTTGKIAIRERVSFPRWDEVLDASDLGVKLEGDEFINIALRAYAPRLWLRAQTSQFRSGHIFSM